MYRYVGQKAKPTAAEINRWNAAADKLLAGPSRLNGAPDIPSQSTWVWVRNDSGEARSRFDCMSLGDPIFDLELDGSIDLLFSADDADPDSQPAILIDEIGDGEFGKAIISGLALAKVATASSASNLFAKPKSTHDLEATESGSIKLLTAPSTSAQTLVPVLLNVGTGGGGSSVWAAYTLTAGMTNEGDYYEAEGDVVEIPGGAVTEEQEIRAYVDTAYAQVIGSKGLVVKVEDWWLVVTPECATPPFEYAES